MITLDFVKMAMDTVLASNKKCLLGNSATTVITEFGAKTLPGTVTSDATSVTWKTNSEVYFDEGGSTTRTVNCINACLVGSGNTYTSYYSMPLQASTEIMEGYMIKVNPYKEANGRHTRGIKVTFSLPE